MRTRVPLAALFLLAPVSATASPEQTLRIVDVASFGAVPDDGIDDTVALSAAFADADPGPVRILLHEGTYDLFKTAPPQGFAFSGIELLQVFGQGATLLLHNFDPAAGPGAPGVYPTRIFDVLDCSGVQFRGLTLKLERESYSLGVISSVSGNPINSIRLELQPGSYDLNDNAYLERLDEYDPVLGYPTSRNMTVSFDSTSQYSFAIDPSAPVPTAVLSTTTSSDPWFVSRMANADVGDGIVMMHSKYRTHFIRALSCTGFTLKHVTIRDGAGMGLVIHNSENITIDDFDMSPRLGRLLSNTADGVHARDCRGSFVMRNCDMERMGDDGLNVYSPYMEVAQVGSGTPLPVLVNELSWYNNQVFQPGEVLHIYSPDLGRKGIATIESFTPVSGSPPNPSSYWVELSSPSTAIAPGDLVTNSANFPDSLLVEDCLFAENMAHGVVAKTHDVMIQRCAFVRNIAAGIILKPDVESWSEAGGVTNVLIDDCTFDDVNRWVWKDRGAISVYGNPVGPSLPPVGLHQDITIQNCGFMNLASEVSNPHCAIWIASTLRAFIGPSNDFTNIAASLPLVRVDQSQDVFIGLNTVDASYAGTPVLVDPQSQSTTYEFNNSWN